MAGMVTTPSMLSVILSSQLVGQMVPSQEALPVTYLGDSLSSPLLFKAHKKPGTKEAGEKHFHPTFPFPARGHGPCMNVMSSSHSTKDQHHVFSLIVGN